MPEAGDGGVFEQGWRKQRRRSQCGNEITAAAFLAHRFVLPISPGLLSGVERMDLQEPASVEDVLQVDVARAQRQKTSDTAHADDYPATEDRAIC